MSVLFVVERIIIYERLLMSDNLSSTEAVRKLLKSHFPSYSFVLYFKYNGNIIVMEMGNFAPRSNPVYKK